MARVLTPALSPPRYGAWTGAQGHSNAELAQSARAQLLAPVLRGLRTLTARLSWLAGATLLGALLGGLLGFVLGATGLGALLGGAVGLLASGVWFSVLDSGRELKQTASGVAAQWRDPYAP